MRVSRGRNSTSFRRPSANMMGAPKPETGDNGVCPPVFDGRTRITRFGRG